MKSIKDTIKPEDNHYLPKRDIVDRLESVDPNLAIGFCMGNSLKYGTRDRIDKPMGDNLDKLHFFINRGKEIVQSLGYSTYTDYLTREVQ